MPVVYLRTRFGMPGSIGLLITKPEAEKIFCTAAMLLFYFLQSRPIIVTEVAYFSSIFHKALLRDHRVSGAGVKDCGIEMSNDVTFVSGFVEIRQLVSKLKRRRGRAPAPAHTHTHTHTRARARARTQAHTHTHTHIILFYFHLLTFT